MNIAQARLMVCDECHRTGSYEVRTARGRRLGVFCGDHARAHVDIWNRREQEMHDAQTTLDDMVSTPA
ncbi:MAG: hypothetical protein DRJ50_09050 [Actinobacteria bacterium]|nr:MAG: hypothetical protein DRJ50_09050 [Actinomycetota bacterium]